MSVVYAFLQLVFYVLIIKLSTATVLQQQLISNIFSKICSEKYRCLEVQNVINLNRKLKIRNLIPLINILQCT